MEMENSYDQGSLTRAEQESAAKLESINFEIRSRQRLLIGLQANTKDINETL